ncbi:hypothetical protein SDC9_104829 [bioreactor metagenome]|uniref:Uncharacterized protein n=1 Tax=bioreactor metagenome TaxID=1076179 RepID=A0A645AXV2_9ZZZZ
MAHVCEELGFCPARLFGNFPCLAECFFVAGPLFYVGYHLGKEKEERFFLFGVNMVGPYRVEPYKTDKVVVVCHRNGYYAFYLLWFQQPPDTCRAVIR